MAKKDFKLKTNTINTNIAAIRDIQAAYKYEEVDKANIVPNERNKKYSQEDLEELKSSIMLHLIHPLSVVYDFDTLNYRIISGERRYRAICLMTEDEYKVSFPNGIPCMVQNAKDLNTVDEEIQLIAANHEVRSADGKVRLWEIKRLLELYETKKKNNEVTNIVNALVEKLNVSPKTVIRTKNVLDTIPAIQELYEAEKIPLVTAESCVRLTETGQMAVATIIKENGEITKEELEVIKEKESRTRADINAAKKGESTEVVSQDRIAEIAKTAKKKTRENSLLKVEKLLISVKKHPTKFDKEETVDLLKKINTMTSELLAQLGE